MMTKMKKFLKWFTRPRLRHQYDEHIEVFSDTDALDPAFSFHIKGRYVLRFPVLTALALIALLSAVVSAFRR